VPRLAQVDLYLLAQDELHEIGEVLLYRRQCQCDDVQRAGCLCRTGEIAALARVDLGGRRVAVLISETMRLNETGNPMLGVWEVHEGRIVVRRDQPRELARFAGTLLHEVGYMLSGTIDGTLEFESELSRLLGATAAAALRSVVAISLAYAVIFGRGLGRWLWSGTTPQVHDAKRVGPAHAHPRLALAVQPMA
jgi:hypothetical protein